MRQKLNAGDRTFEQVLPSELKEGDSFFELGRGGQLVEGVLTSNPKEYVYDKKQQAFTAKPKDQDNEIHFNIINDLNNQIKLFKELT